MADKQPVKGKRRVKNPETFRERALKASETDAQSKTRPARQAMGTIFGFVFRPVYRLLKVVFALPPFRFLGRILFVGSLHRSWQELSQVTWPNWRQSWRLTLAVLIFAMIFGATIAAVDYGVENAFKEVLLK